MSSETMNCKDFESWIALDAGGDLPAADAAALEQHLAACPACRRFAEEMRQSRQAVVSLRHAPIDRAALLTVRSQVLSQTEDDATGGYLPRWALAAAAVLAMTVGAAWLMRSHLEPQPAQALEPRAHLEPTPPQTAQPSPVARSTDEPPTSPPAPSASTPIEAPSHEAPRSQEAPVQEIPAREAPVQEAPPPEAPVQEIPAQEAPFREALPREALPRETPPREAPPRNVPPPPEEPMLIKLVSEDGDLVIYWLVDPAHPTTQETRDETSAV